MPKTQKTAAAKTKAPAQVIDFEDAKLDTLEAIVSGMEETLLSLETLFPTLSPDALGRATVLLRRITKCLDAGNGAGVLADLKARLLVLTIKDGDDDGLVQTPHFRIKRVEQTRRSVSVPKLIDAGVTPSQIAAATTTSESSYARVTAKT